MNGLHPAYPIQTERLLFRPFMPGNFDALFAVHSRPEVARCLYWEARTEAEVRGVLDRKIGSRGIDEEGDVLALAAVARETLEAVGDFILKRGTRT